MLQAAPSPTWVPSALPVRRGMAVLGSIKPPARPSAPVPAPAPAPRSAFLELDMPVKAGPVRSALVGDIPTSPAPWETAQDPLRASVGPVRSALIGDGPTSAGESPHNPLPAREVPIRSALIGNIPTAPGESAQHPLPVRAAPVQSALLGDIPSLPAAVETTENPPPSIAVPRQCAPIGDIPTPSAPSGGGPTPLVQNAGALRSALVDKGLTPVAPSGGGPPQLDLTTGAMRSALVGEVSTPMALSAVGRPPLVAGVDSIRSALIDNVPASRSGPPPLVASVEGVRSVLVGPLPAAAATSDCCGPTPGSGPSTSQSHAASPTLPERIGSAQLPVPPTTLPVLETPGSWADEVEANESSAGYLPPSPRPETPRGAAGAPALSSSRGLLGTEGPKTLQIPPGMSASPRFRGPSAVSPAVLADTWRRRDAPADLPEPTAAWGQKGKAGWGNTQLPQSTTGTPRVAVGTDLMQGVPGSGPFPRGLPSGVGVLSPRVDSGTVLSPRGVPAAKPRAAEPGNAAEVGAQETLEAGMDIIEEGVSAAIQVRNPHLAMTRCCFVCMRGVAGREDISQHAECCLWQDDVQPLQVANREIVHRALEIPDNCQEEDIGSTEGFYSTGWYRRAVHPAGGMSRGKMESMGESCILCTCP
jgi:hypothetical protein